MSNGTGNFAFYEDYEKTVFALQPELYREIGSIIDSEIRRFVERTGSPPRIMDVGSAGVTPFDTALARSTTILDLFEKPPNLALKSNVVWRVGDILDTQAVKACEFDIVIISSVLHHLADRRNNVVANIELAFRNISSYLKRGGVLLIFESVCPNALATAQDLLYPVYSRILVRLFKFTYVRMLSLGEIVRALNSAGLSQEEVPFRQPSHIAQMRWRVPSKYYPLKVCCLKATTRS